MSDRLTEIREMIEHIKRAIASFSVEWPSLLKKTPGALYVRDVGYLLGLLTEHPGSEPPGDDRRVLVWIYGNWHTGKHRPVNGWHVGHSDNLPVEAWQELPPSRKQ